MEESLRSILCNGGHKRYLGQWKHGDDGIFCFKSDNTGLIIARGECYWAMLADFDWKITTISPSSQDQNQTSEDSGSPRLISEFNMEIQITKHLDPKEPKSEKKMDQIFLTDDALQPRSFNVRLEEGRFPSRPQSLNPDYFASEETPYTKRLVFDISPFPPESAWTELFMDSWRECEGENWWDNKIFVNYDPRHGEPEMPAKIECDPSGVPDPRG
ncbi:hypothetical protein BT63DRAFT_451109 [Microthyrium microscopicum]|uniref:Uncharacterized protein n=1 Tax=Microthyrium microscopicum TaxID=703497 RepID=A0A6A6ULG6_9PEZI|nr:hypothetical protein BT63DRAFT_451109 [Microthyrium microscopicum]